MTFITQMFLFHIKTVSYLLKYSLGIYIYRCRYGNMPKTHCLKKKSHDAEWHVEYKLCCFKKNHRGRELEQMYT